MKLPHIPPRLQQAARILLGLVLLVVVLLRVPLHELTAVMRQVDVRFLLGALLFDFLMLFLQGWRYYILYGISAQTRPPFWYLTMLTFIGFFFSQFLPSTVGGDVYRVIHMGGEEKGYSKAFSVVFVDRLVGLFTLMALALLALAIGYREIQLPVSVAYWSAALFIGIALALFISIQPLTHRLVQSVSGRLLPQTWCEWVLPRLERIADHLTLYAGQPALLLWSSIVSLASRLAWIVGCAFVGAALRLNVSFFVYLTAHSVIDLIRVIPITIQGVGIREGLFVAIFTRFGLSNAQATVLALLTYLLLIGNALLGGVFYLLPWKKAWSGGSQNG